VQDDALVELHDRVDDCPALIDFGLAEREAVVSGGGVVNKRSPGPGQIQGVEEPLVCATGSIDQKIGIGENRLSCTR
jgi:hypothetical protein